MRKLISYILTLAILISTLSVCTGVFLNASGSADELTVDFEGKYSEFYADNCLTDPGNTADTVDIGGAHGNVMHVKYMKVYRPDFSEGDRYFSITQWPAAFFLADSMGNKASYQKGEKLAVSFQMKKNSDIDDTDFQKFFGALIFDDGLESKVEKGNIGSLNDYVDGGKLVNVASSSCSKDSDWVNYNGVITVPNSGIAAFVIYATEWNTDCDIYVDNIVIKKGESVVTECTVNFEDEQEDFYKSNYLAPSDNTTTVENIGGQHGNVMHVKRIRVYRPDFSEGDRYFSITQWPATFFITDSMGNKVSYKKGDKLAVSFQMKKNADIDDTDFQKFFGALVFDDELENKVAKSNIGSLNDYIDGGKLVNIDSSDCSEDSDWVTYSGTVTVPKSGLAAFVIYATEWGTDCDIYVDNINIKKAVAANVKCDINFEDKQGDFYKSNYLAPSDNTTTVENIGGEHGNVMHVKRIRVYRPDFSEGDRYFSITQWPAAFFIADAEGNKVSYKQGDRLTVSFQMKKNADIDDTDFQKFFAALIFDDELENKVAKSNIGSINDYINSGKLVDITSSSCSKDSDWVNYNGVITVPKNGLAAFVIYATEWGADCDIYIDNISLNAVDDNAETTVNIHNYDGNGGIKQVVLKQSAVFSSIETPFRADKKFDGWYLDEDLTRKAEGFIGSIPDIWVKWSDVAFKTVNTFDDAGVEYIEEKDGSYVLVKRKVNGVAADERYFSQYNAQIVDNEFDTSAGKSAKFTVAHGYTFNWPATLSLYDSNDEGLKVFTPKPNTAYKLKLKYKAELKPAQELNLQIRRLAGDSKIQYIPENILCEQITEISMANKDWVTVEKTFYTGDDVSNLALVLCTVNSTTYGETAKDVCVWIDDIELEEVFNTPAIYFDSVGGSTLSKQPNVAGEKIPSLPVPKKSGHIFDGWFYDPEYTSSFSAEIMPEENVRLYARWKPVAAAPYTLEMDFEGDEYANNGTAQNVSDSYISKYAQTVNNPIEAYGGNNYLKITDPGMNKHSSVGMPAVAFVNPDGTGYEVIKGKRYHISLAFKCGVAASHYLVFASSQQIPIGGLNLKNSTEEFAYGYSNLRSETAMDEWGEYDFYFIAKNTGKLYLILYGDGEKAEISVDNFKIEETPAGEASLVSYYDEDGELLKEEYDAVGAWLADADLTNKENKEFAGWFNENGELYLGNKFPAEDTSFYARWTAAEDLSSASTDWSKDVTVDFEDAEGAKAFYGVYNNSYEPMRGTFFVANDPENAHSGNGYYKFYQVGVWGSGSTWYRRFKFYDNNSLGNQIYLEPNSVYKVSYWLNVERAGNSCIMLTAFSSRTDIIECFNEGYNYLTDATVASDIGKWVQHEATITTGDEPTVLGMAVSGGYFTAALDDITVTKLKDVTVRFESNGGSTVNPITVLSYDYAIAPDYPEKEGYSFAGWYSDKELTKRFRFNETQLTSDITLYAKWEKDFVPETVTEKVTEYRKEEQEVENEISDAHLDEAITVNTSDKPSGNKVKPIQNDDTRQSAVPWLIIALIALSVLCAAAAIIIILVIKKRKNGGKV